jgi:hypothetical protein
VGKPVQKRFFLADAGTKNPKSIAALTGDFHLPSAQLSDLLVCCFGTKNFLLNYRSYAGVFHGSNMTDEDNIFLQELKGLDPDDRPLLDQNSAVRLLKIFKEVN